MVHCVYIVIKSTSESRAQYASKPTWGFCKSKIWWIFRLFTLDSDLSFILESLLSSLVTVRH